MNYLYSLITLSVLLAGCSGTIYRDTSIDGWHNTKVLDARQRVILVTNEGGKYNTGYDERGKYHPHMEGYRKVVCTEPSPDVAVALAAEGKASITVKGSGKQNFEGGGVAKSGEMSKEVGADGSFKSSETLTNISQRTQTIQLLRDGLFRACEAHMNGIIDENEYRSIVNGYDDFVITMLAIDGMSDATVIQQIIEAYYKQQKWYINKFMK